VIVCDTGPLVAAALVNDDHHRECVDLFTGLHLAGRRLLVPALVVAEVADLLAREAGPRIEALFVQSLADGDLVAIDITGGDYARLAELITTYGDLPLGATDAAVVALCERLGLTEVATLDRRHFGVVKPRHVDRLTLLP
jgi:uncharacterized protein